MMSVDMGGAPEASVEGPVDITLWTLCPALPRNTVQPIETPPPPGNLLLRSNDTGLPQDSVANVSLVTALDKQVITNRLRKIPRRRFELILSGIDTILGR
jgi:mRNA-degrading endonuclease toxin of MazEF toxin-antitoxin module